MTDNTEPTIDAISRQQFARLANPAKHYLIDNVGMDELNAGLMAANIVEAQSNTVLALISDQVAKAVDKTLTDLEDFKQEVLESRGIPNPTYVGKKELQEWIDNRRATLNGVSQ